MTIATMLTSALTFDDYMLQQASRAFRSGPLLNPSVSLALPRLLTRMKKSRKIRAELREQRDLLVPAVLFMAVTGECNLRCAHCYTSGYRREHMPTPLARRILSEAYDLGVSLIIVTGGEPLLHSEFLSLPPRMPDVPFLIFTNGLLVPDFLASGRQSPNMLWAVSVDGPQPYCDARRSHGTYDAVCRAMSALRARGLPFGFSATVSTDNLDATLSPDFVEEMAAKGCRSGFFLEQIPGPLCDPPMGEQIAEKLAMCRDLSPIPLLGFPADEIRYGGCQAGGNGIAHISPQGFVEPCPAAHIAVDCVSETPLVEAFANPFFKKFRELKEEFTTGMESCTYAEHGEAIREGLASSGMAATTR
jgi:MoaA/NifB/PqqE/SkfB family radical SAM enzyme